MPSPFSRLRVWFGVSALLVLAIVAGFYGYARYRVRRVVRDLPARLGVDIQQNTSGFTYSQSAGGRTIFSITASTAVRYKEGSKAELHSVKIVSYGRDSDRLDQITGDDFEYDSKTGDISSNGKVAIQLQGAQAGTSTPGGNPIKIGSAVHLDANGMLFNKNTGVARTAGKVTFQLPQGSGSAVGAEYNSKQNRLDLASDIHLHTVGPKPMDLSASSASFEQDSQELSLTKLHEDSGVRHVDATRAVLHLRDDNTVERADAMDGVDVHIAGVRSADAHAAVAHFLLGTKNEIKSGRLEGGLTWKTGGAELSSGSAGRALLSFGPNGQLKSAQLRENVDLTEFRSGIDGALAQGSNSSANGSPAATNEFRGDGLDLQVAEGKLTQATSDGRAQIVLTGAQSPSATAGNKNSRTVITAGRFLAKFSDNQISTLTGAAPVQIVSSTPGQPDRTSQSHDLLATFAKGQNATLQNVIQTGNVQMHEGQRSASADRATFTQASDSMTLSGNARYVDAASGSTLTSNTLVLDRSGGETTASGGVKTTYAEQKPQASGAMLSPAVPVHVTAEQMVQKNSTSTARFSGHARLWQGENVVQAPEMDFNRNDRTLQAQAEGSERVSTVFVQADKAGKSAPVEVTADRLHYNDAERKASFDGSVALHTADSSMHADRADVFLRPQATGAQARGSIRSGAPSQVQSIDAMGNIQLQQPGRHASGAHLVYTDDDEKFVLTGTPGRPPSIFDAEHGQVTGVSLTFFNRDDRVLVDSSNSTSITQTRLKK